MPRELKDVIGVMSLIVSIGAAVGFTVACMNARFYFGFLALGSAILMLLSIVALSNNET